MSKILEESKYETLETQGDKSSHRSPIKINPSVAGRLYALFLIFFRSLQSHKKHLPYRWKQNLKSYIEEQNRQIQDLTSD